jgi:TolB protein
MNTGASSLIPALSDIDNLSWSPDNNYLAGSFNGQIVLVNLDGTIIRTLTQRGSNYNPTWSPDGKYIAFSSNRDGNSEIYAISIDGLNEQRLTNNSTYDCCPIWTP